MDSINARRRYRPTPSLLISFTALLLAVSTFAAGALSGSSGQISACYKRKGGALRLVRSGQKCRRGERSVTWSQRGPAGSDAQFVGAAAGGDLEGTYPNPTVKPAPATRLLADTQLQNGWVNNDLAGERQVGYFKDRDGVVYLQGVAGHTPASTAVIFILPIGLRPAKEIHVPAMADAGLATPAGVRIGANGNVSPLAAGGNQSISFDGISFRAD